MTGTIRRGGDWVAVSAWSKFLSVAVQKAAQMLEELQLVLAGVR
jgi:hypothetical protein